MTLPLLLWVAALSGGPADTSAEPWRSHEDECHRREDAGEYAEAADACRQAFEAVPAGPLAFDKRSLFAFKAARLYKRASAAASATAERLPRLCAAAAVLRTFEAQLGTLPAADRPRDRADVADKLRELETKIGGACAPAQDDLIDLGRTVDRREATPIVRPDPPAGPTTMQPARHRPLRISGWTVLGGGLAVGSAAIVMLVKGSAMRDTTDALNARYPDGVMIPAMEAQRFHDAKIGGERADRLAIGLGVPALALALSGVALLAIDAHRGRADRRFALHPGPAGLRLSMEF